MGKSEKSQSAGNRWIYKDRLWIPVFMMVGISILSGGASLSMGPVSFVGIDKLGHFIVYGLLAVSMVRATDHRRLGGFRSWWIAVILTTVFGLLSEWYQLHIPGRYFEWADLLADFSGALVFSGMYLRFPALRKFMEYKLC